MRKRPVDQNLTNALKKSLAHLESEADSTDEVIFVNKPKAIKPKKEAIGYSNAPMKIGVRNQLIAVESTSQTTFDLVVKLKDILEGTVHLRPDGDYDGEESAEQTQSLAQRLNHMQNRQIAIHEMLERCIEELQ